MPLYAYKIKDKHNQIVEDTIQALNPKDAASILKNNGFEVLAVHNLDQKKSFFSRKVSTAQKASLCRFLATMIKAGLSLPEAVEIIKQESENKFLQEILADVASQVRKGKSLSIVLAGYKEVFDPVFLTMVKAGEESGSLEKVFDYLAKQLLTSYELSQKVKGSLMYPIVVITAMMGVGIIMLVFVLPRISQVFLKMHIDLPIVTKLILNFGVFVGAHVFGVLFSVGLIIAVMIFLVIFKPSKKIVLNFFTKLPGPRKIMTQIDTARFSRTLATLLKSGVPIIDALNVSAQVLTQPSLKQKAQEFSRSIAKGESLSSVLTRSKGGFPLIMTQTIRAGEKTGSLEKVLIDMAKFYEREVEFSLKRFIALLEPVLMLVVGIAVGAMVIVVIAPIYSIIGGLQNSIKK